MNTTPAAAGHTCYGARFCGFPAAVATAECPVCTPVRPLLDVLAEHVAKVTAARATLTVADLDRMATDDRWLGFGYLGERRNAYASVPGGEWAEALRGDVERVDERVVSFANHRGMTYEALFAWANSKAGRHFGDVLFGSSGPFEARWAEAVRFNLHPDA